jgi:putative Mg2+ transporter-C (MgtC) family protein
MFTVTSIWMTITLALGDPARIPSQVVSGIGFIGAGAVWKTGASVSGLTTAASLWSVAAIGLACGFGFIDGALVLTALVLATLLILGHIEHHAKKRSNGDE